MNLHQKLVELRKIIEYAQKDKENTFFKFKYVSGTALLAAIRPKMDDLGLLLVPSFTSSEPVIEAKTDKGKQLWVVQGPMTMTWIDAESGESLEAEWYGYGAQDDPSKAFGSALTYSERYFLLKFFNVPTDDLDPDAFQKKHGPPPEKEATVEQLKDLLAWVRKKHPEMTATEAKEVLRIRLRDTYGVEKAQDLSLDEANVQINYFKRLVEQGDTGAPVEEESVSEDGFQPVRSGTWAEIKSLCDLMGLILSQVISKAPSGALKKTLTEDDALAIRDNLRQRRKEWMEGLDKAEPTQTPTEDTEGPAEDVKNQEKLGDYDE